MNVFKLIEDNGLTLHGDIEHFAELIRQEEREKVAAWMIRSGYATGHGDTIEDLLQELEWQIAENQPQEFVLTQTDVGIGDAQAIRARGEQ
jgi:hypothetical protein